MALKRMCDNTRVGSKTFSRIISIYLYHMAELSCQDPPPERRRRRKRSVQEDADLELTHWDVTQQGEGEFHQDNLSGEVQVAGRVPYYKLQEGQSWQWKFIVQQSQLRIQVSRSTRGEHLLKFEILSDPALQLELEYECRLFWVAASRLNSRTFRGKRKLPLAVGSIRVVTESDLYFEVAIIKLRKESPHGLVGLLNQGNTCYMNSFLQTLFHLTALTRVVFQLKSQRNKFPHTLQDLYYKLLNSKDAVSTESLCRSYGWGRKHSWIQQDIQEFGCLFFQVLEKKIDQNPETRGRLRQLLQGTILNYIKCTDVPYCSQRQQSFLDLQLPVKDMGSLTDSMNFVTMPEEMSGDNLYETPNFGKQQALKGMVLKEIPPVFMLHLKRFQYDPIYFNNIKLNNRYTYDEYMDFGPWTFTKESQMYRLYSVLVHEGNKAGSGHYFTFINKYEKWYNFNDEIIQEVSSTAAISNNTGGLSKKIFFNRETLKFEEMEHQTIAAAYMLIYIKADQWQLLTKDIDHHEVPKIVLEQEELKMKQQQLSKAIEDQRTLKFCLYSSVVKEVEQSLGLFYYKRARNDPLLYYSTNQQVYYTFKKTDTLALVFQYVAKETGLARCQFSLWWAQVSKNKQMLKYVDPANSQFSIAAYFGLHSKSADLPLLVILTERPLKVQFVQDKYQFIKLESSLKQPQLNLKEKLVVFIKLFKEGRYELQDFRLLGIDLTYKQLYAMIELEYGSSNFKLSIETSLVETRDCKLYQTKVHPVNLIKNQAIVLHLFLEPQHFVDLTPVNLLVQLIDQNDQSTVLIMQPKASVNQIIHKLPGDPNKIFIKYKKSKNAKLYRDAEGDLTVQQLVEFSEVVYWYQGEVDYIRRNDWAVINYEHQGVPKKIEVSLKANYDDLQKAVSAELGKEVILFKYDRLLQRILDRPKPDQPVKFKDRNRLVAVDPPESPNNLLVLVTQKARTGQIMGYPFYKWLPRPLSKQDLQACLFSQLLQLKIVFQKKAVTVDREKLRVLVSVKESKRAIGEVDESSWLQIQEGRLLHVQLLHLNVAKAQPAISIDVD